MLLMFMSALALAGSMSTTECTSDDGQFVVTTRSWVAPGTQTSGSNLTLSHEGTLLAERRHTSAGPPNNEPAVSGQLVAEWDWPNKTPDPSSDAPVPGGHYVERYHIEASFTRADGAPFGPELPTRLDLTLSCATTHYPPPPATRSR